MCLALHSRKLLFASQVGKMSTDYGDLQFFIVHLRLWSDGRRTLIQIVLNLFLVSKMSHRRSSVVQEITATDGDLLLDHDESFYCGDDSSEDEESASPAGKRADNSNNYENYSSDEDSDAGEQPATEIQEA